MTLSDAQMQDRLQKLLQVTAGHWQLAPQPVALRRPVRPACRPVALTTPRAPRPLPPRGVLLFAV